MFIKLQCFVINGQFWVNYIFQAYSCNSMLMNRETVVPHMDYIANKGIWNSLSRTSVSRPFQGDACLSPRWYGLSLKYFVCNKLNIAVKLVVRDVWQGLLLQNLSREHLSWVDAECCCLRTVSNSSFTSKSYTARVSIQQQRTVNVWPWKRQLLEHSAWIHWLGFKPKSGETFSASQSSTLSQEHSVMSGKWML